MYLAYVIATVGWTGLLPASGTATSLATTIVAYLAFRQGLTGWWLVVGIVASFITGLYVVSAAESYMCAKWGPRRRHTGAVVTRDYQQTTIDELHGQLLALSPVFFFTGLDSGGVVTWFFVSFMAFRAFDISKIWPVGWLERRYSESSFGIMIDDTAAAVEAALVLVLMRWMFR